MKFKSDRQRKAVMININKYGVSLKKNKGWHELPNPVTKKAPLHQKAAYKAKIRNALDRPLSRPVISRNQAFDLVIRKAGRFAIPLVFSLAGLGDPSVANAGLNSLEDSFKIYKKSGNIDDAVISGVESFVKNYAINKVESYLVNDFSLFKDDDSTYEAALKGAISMTSLYAVMRYIK